jgi:hypothetical protein
MKRTENSDVGTVPERVKLDKPMPEVRIATSIQGLSFGDRAAKAMHAAGDRKPIVWQTFLTCTHEENSHMHVERLTQDKVSRAFRCSDST